MERRATDGPPLLASVRLPMVLRTIAVCGQVAPIVVWTALRVALPLAAMTAVITLLVALNMVTRFRLTRPKPATHVEIGGHLLEDRGAGIPPAKLDMLGRLMFTTKPPEKGRGLSLMLAAHAVNMLEGTLHWEARSGSGTWARMVLPLRVLRLPEPRGAA